MRSFGENIYTRKASLFEAEEDESILLEYLVEFNDKSKPKNKNGKHKKRDTYESAYTLCEG